MASNHRSNRHMWQKEEFEFIHSENINESPYNILDYV